MDEDDAVDALERLGLTSYEAKVFIALHRIGSGTARGVADVTDVPRSQVYSAAESLADRGLVEIQQSSPKQFRPVSVEAARSTLRERFERESERAFEYVSQARTEDVEETKEDVWTIRGAEGIADRTVELIRGAEEIAVFGARDPELLTDRIERAIRDRANAGVTTIVVSRQSSVKDRFVGDSQVATIEPPAGLETDNSGRVVMADRDAILMSVVTPNADETAIWSSGSSIASVLIQIVAGSLGVE